MLTQAELERKVEVFTTNGKKPEAQAVIGKVGYVPAKLDEHATLLADIRLGHSTVPAALKVQKQATATEAATREAASKAVVSLSDTGRTVFAGDEPTLAALGLTPHYETATGPDGQPTGPVAARLSESTAEVIKRWRSQVGVAASLPADKAAILSAAGWNSGRVKAAQDAVEAYAQADTDQQVAIQAYQKLSDQQTANIEALRAWYTTAAALSKRAIKDADPDNHQQLLELLDL
jgi:hypothetical protein